MVRMLVREDENVVSHAPENLKRPAASPMIPAEKDIEPLLCRGLGDDGPGYHCLAIGKAERRAGAMVFRGASRCFFISLF